MGRLGQPWRLRESRLSGDAASSPTTKEPSVLQSSHHGVRYFCSDCGTHVACMNDSHAELIDIPVGRLDRPEAVVPQKDIFADTRLPWV